MHEVEVIEALLLLGTPVEYDNKIKTQRLRSSLEAIQVEFAEFRKETEKGFKYLENRLEDLEMRLEDIKRNQEDLRNIRVSEEKVIWEWETCNRIAQGINDYMRRKVLESVESDLNEVKVIWESPLLRKSRLRYLPHLLAVWWIRWNKEDPVAYPLPPAFRPISDSQRQYYELIPTLSEDINHAAETLWTSKYQPLLILMLTMHLSRPKHRDVVQHPTPPASFAKAFVHSSAQLARRGIEIATQIIDSGHKIQDRRFEFLFDHGDMDPWEIGNLDRYLDGVLQSGIDGGDLLFLSDDEEGGEVMQLEGHLTYKDME